MASKRKNGEWRTTHRDAEHRQREITLPGDLVKSTAVEFERLSRVLAAYVYFDVPIEKKDQRRIDDFAEGLKNKWIKHGLLPGKPEVLTVQSLVERFKAKRCGVKELTITSEKAALQDIVDYCVPDTDVNDVTVEKAEGYRPWMLKDRVPVLCIATANRRVGKAKQVFDAAERWGYIGKSPFANIKAGSSTNPDNQDCIDHDRFMALFNVCADEPELQCILGCVAYGSLRITSDTNPIKFSDIVSVEIDGRKYGVLMVAEKSKGTKTGGRPVVIVPQWQSCFDAVEAAKAPGQELVFVNYRTTAKIRSALYRRAVRAGIVQKGEKLWNKLFNALRSTRITHCDNAGMPDALQDIMFGNTAKVREAHYKLKRKGFKTVEEYVKAVLPYLSSGAGAEKSPIESPIESPIISHQNSPVLSMIDNGEDWQETVESALKCVGYTDADARMIVEKDRYAHSFYDDLKYCRERVCDWKERRISFAGMVGSVLSYAVKIHYRALRGSAVSKTFLDLDNFDKLAGAGLEPARPYGQGILNP